MCEENCFNCADYDCLMTDEPCKSCIEKKPTGITEGHYTFIYHNWRPENIIDDGNCQMNFTEAKHD